MLLQLIPVGFEGVIGITQLRIVLDRDYANLLVP
jgi:hypothetical protein